MKRTLLLPLALIGITGAMAQTVILNEPFDDHAVGTGMSVNDPANWGIWPGGEDQFVTAAQARSGTKSLGCISTSVVNGGPGDLLLLLGDRTSGVYDLSWWMYIPDAKGGYFNVQHTEDVTTPSFAAEVIFNGGNVSGAANNVDITGIYPIAAWFEVRMIFDLNNSTAALSVNGAELLAWPFATETDGTVGLNQLGCIDFFSYGGGTVIGEAYVDDVLYSDISNISIEETAVGQLRSYPNPANDALTIEGGFGSASTAVQFFDAAGKQVQVPVMRSGDLLRADVAGLASGLYTVRINNSGKLSVGSFAKL